MAIIVAQRLPTAKPDYKNARSQGVMNITFENPEFSGEWTGQLIDSFGSSTLSDVEFDDSTLCFTKRYDNRRDDIDYEFR